jgi:hypothetical protein
MKKSEQKFGAATDNMLRKAKKERIAKNKRDKAKMKEWLRR